MFSTLKSPFCPPVGLPSRKRHALHCVICQTPTAPDRQCFRMDLLTGKCSYVMLRRVKYATGDVTVPGIPSVQTFMSHSLTISLYTER